MTTRTLALAVAIALGVLAPRVARAQDAALEKARTAFEDGQDLFEKGDYPGAAAKFAEAYADKPFPAFLYNEAVCYERLKDYQKAVDLFEQYLKEDPKAQDKKDVEKRIAAMKGELEAAKKPPSGGTGGTTTPTTQPTTQPTTPTVASLPQATTHGLVVIESKPPGAQIYLDDKKSGSLGTTPWNGSLDENHTIIIEAKGYKTEKKEISPSADKLVYMYFALSEQQNLGWLEVKANVPGADVYLDDKSIGAIGRTPFMGNIKPGKHTIIVSKQGYGEASQEIDLEAGQTKDVTLSIEKAKVAELHVTGATTEGAVVAIDGKKLCTAPCEKEIPSGEHTITVWKSGKKTYNRTMKFGDATATSLEVKLQPTQGHADAIWEFVFAAAFTTGGYFLGKQSNEYYDSLKKDEQAGMPPIDAKDDRFLRGRLFAYSADAMFAIGGVTAMVAIYDLFRDHGPSSSGVAESRDLSWAPMIGPDVAGVSVSGAVPW